VDVAMVSGGGAYKSDASGQATGGGGGIVTGLHYLTNAGSPLAIVVGKGGKNKGSGSTYYGTASQIGDLASQIYGFGVGGGTGLETNYTYPIPVQLTGSTVYLSGRSGQPNVQYGYGAVLNKDPSDGVVIVRVPADLAAGVNPNDYNDITTFDLAKQAAKDAAKSAVKETVKDKRKKR
jgi:hypothetical protein